MARPAPGGEAMMPQLGESFLDRLVEISTMNSDIEYRQGLTDRIIEESVAVAALEREQAYYEDLSRSVTELGPSSGGADRERELVSVEASFEGAFDQVVAAVDQVNAIYEELSTHNLNPTTLLYNRDRAVHHAHGAHSVATHRRFIRGAGLHAEPFPRAARLPGSQLLSARGRSPGGRRAARTKSAGRTVRRAA